MNQRDAFYLIFGTRGAQGMGLASLLVSLIIMGLVPTTVAAQRKAGHKMGGDQGKDLIWTATVNRIERLGVLEQAPEVVDPTSVYSNVTTYAGSALLNGNASTDTTAPANTITATLADNVHMVTTVSSGPPYNFTAIKFVVANANTSAVSVRLRVRFWQPNGPNGGPGTFITGISSSNAISFTANSLTTLTLTGATPMAFQDFWTGIAYDNNAGTSGATVAQLNNFGVGLFNPVDRGSSADNYFRSTAGDNFFGINNPAGAIADTTGVVDNFGLEFLTASTVTSSMVSVGGRVVSSAGRGISGTKVILGSQDGLQRTTTTDRLGNFVFDDVESGQSYLITVSSRRYEFDPPSQLISVTDNVADISFTGSPR